MMLTARRLTIFLCLAAVAAIPAQGLAATPPEEVEETEEAPSEPYLRQEVAGLEVHVLSSVQGDGVDPRMALGIGGLLRIGRHRWSKAYFTPLQAGMFVSGGTSSERDIISARVLTEGGAVFHFEVGALELGLGAGAGVLGIAYGVNRCDGTCRIGGIGVLFSPVVRFLFRESTHVPIGVVLRGEIPAVSPDGPIIIGWGSQVLLGLDVGAGW